MARLSVAVWPPAEAVQRLAALERPEVPGVRWSVPAQWMVKVRPLGTVADRIVPELVGTLEEALDGAPAAACVLGPATRRLGDWLAVPVAGLEDLAAVVFEETEPLGPVTHPQPFHAEVILARGRVPRELAGQPLSAAWTADSVSLVADRSSPRAPRYENLATFPLTP